MSREFLFLPDLVDVYAPNPEDRMHQRLTNLEQRIEQLAHSVELLVQVNPEVALPEACRKRDCTYYNNYLRYAPNGGPGLNHEQYHIAERLHLEHVTGCKWGDEPCKTCLYHEEKIRA